MRLAHGVVTVALLLLGVIHLGITPSLADGLDAAGLWFAGSGLFLIAASALNLAVIRTAREDRLIAYAAVGINTLGVVMALWAISAVGGPPPYVLFVVFGVAAVASFPTVGSGEEGSGSG
jgi:hypothetical protein